MTGGRNTNGWVGLLKELGSDPEAGERRSLEEQLTGSAGHA